MDLQGGNTKQDDAKVTVGSVLDSLGLTPKLKADSPPGNSYSISRYLA